MAAVPAEHVMTKDDVFAGIGLIVIETQTVEAFLNLILIYVLQDGSLLTHERITLLEKQQSRKTLGAFYKAMKERADYSLGLEKVFDRFLENRNRLIHRFKEVNGHELSSEADFGQVYSFLDQLHQDTWNLLKFLAAWIVSWQEQTGIGKGSLENAMPKEGKALLEEINFMSGFVNDHVFCKK